MTRLRFLQNRGLHLLEENLGSLNPTAHPEAHVGAIMVSWVLELDAFVFRIMLVVTIGNWLFPPLMIFNKKLYCVKSASSWLIGSSSSEEESWLADWTFGPAFHCESKALLFQYGCHWCHESLHCLWIYKLQRLRLVLPQVLDSLSPTRLVLV